MKLKQLTALGQLYEAIEAATDAGLFDALTANAHPDVINKFCDLVTSEFVQEKAKGIFQPGQKLILVKRQSVLCNGFSGTIVNVHSGKLDGMVDVRLDSGTVTVEATYPNCIPLPIEAEETPNEIKAGILANRLESLLAQLRRVAIEPMSIQYSKDVDIEIRPVADDDRVLVGRKDWGDTIVNYTTEGLVVDVFRQNDITVLSTQCFYQEALVEQVTPGDTTTAVPLTQEQLVQNIKNEILIEMDAGIIPRTVSSFSELHDYIDANCLGGLCKDEVSNALAAKCGGLDRHGGMPQGMLDLINAAQDEVGKWLAERAKAEKPSS